MLDYSVGLGGAGGAGQAGELWGADPGLGAEQGAGQQGELGSGEQQTEVILAFTLLVTILLTFIG